MSWSASLKRAKKFRRSASIGWLCHLLIITTSIFHSALSLLAQVIDNGHYSLSGEELWTHLNFHLIHALDFLPVLAWKETKHSDFMFHIFTRLYAIITRAAKLQVSGACFVGGHTSPVQTPFPP